MHMLVPIDKVRRLIGMFFKRIQLTSNLPLNLASIQGSKIAPDD